jgi:hypothetical protein
MARGNGAFQMTDTPNEEPDAPDEVLDVDPDPDELWDYDLVRDTVLPDAKKQPDRYLVIIMAAIIDEGLGEIIQRRLVDHRKTAKKLFRPEGPLGTFSAKIDLGFMLGMYYEEFAKMLHSIREIRNKFAHDMRPLTLESDELKVKAAALKFIETRYHPHRERRTQRELFISACEYILGGLDAMGSDRRRFKTPRIGRKPSGRPS